MRYSDDQQRYSAADELMIWDTKSGARLWSGFAQDGPLGWVDVDAGRLLLIREAEAAEQGGARLSSSWQRLTTQQSIDVLRNSPCQRQAAACAVCDGRKRAHARC